MLNNVLKVKSPILKIVYSWINRPTICQARLLGIISKRPIYIGKNQNPKNLFLLLYRLQLPEKLITFGVFGTKSACAKKPESHTCVFGKWCACATSLYLWPYTCSAHYVAGRGRVIPLKVTYHVTKNPNNTGEIGASVYIGKKPVKFRRSFKKSRCGGGFFGVFRGSCLATFNEKPECEKDSGFLMPV